MPAALRDLPALNANYQPSRPWVCLTHAQHTCVGPVVGALGALPVCANGAAAERAAQAADAARIAAWTTSPGGRRALAQEAALERAIEYR